MDSLTGKKAGVKCTVGGNTGTGTCAAKGLGYGINQANFSCTIFEGIAICCLSGSLVRKLAQWPLLTDALQPLRTDTTRLLLQ